MPDEQIIARLRATGGSAFRREMRSTAKDVRSVGQEFKKSASGVSSYVKASAGLAGGYLAGRGIKSALTAGFQYNKMLDGQRIAFTTLLGSRKAAADFMQRIRQLALDSPVLDPQTTGDAARMLMAYGLNAKQTLPFVKALGDMSAATGRDLSETLPRGALALGQIAGKGTLQAEELNQLAESVGLSRKRIAKELGLTSKEFQDTFKPGKGISSAKALPAILKAMQDQSGGAAARLSKTTQGRLARFSEVWKQALGQLTKDVYNEGGRVVGSLADAIQPVWQRKDLDPGQKLAESFRLAKPIIHQEIDKLDLPGKLRSVATDAARGFGQAWLNASWGVKGLTAGVLATKLGITGGIIRALGGRVGKGIAGQLSAAPAMNIRAAVVNVYGGAGVAGGPGSTAKSLAGKVGAAGAAGVAVGALGVEGAAILDPGNKTLARRLRQRGMASPLTGRYPGAARQTQPSGLGLTDPIGPPGPFQVAPHARVAPRAKGASRGMIHITVPVKIDGRQLGKATAKVTANDLLGG